MLLWTILYICLKFFYCYCSLLNYSFCVGWKPEVDKYILKSQQQKWINKCKYTDTIDVIRGKTLYCSQVMTSRYSRDAFNTHLYFKLLNKQRYKWKDDEWAEYCFLKIVYWLHALFINPKSLGLICPHHFQPDISPWNNGSWDLKIDFKQIFMNFLKILKWGFYSDFVHCVI